MHRFRWRLAAVLSGTVLVSLLLVGAASVNVWAGGSGMLIDMGGWWKDPACGTAQEKFVARLWKDANFSGESWKFCSDYSDFCWAPYGSTSSDALACQTGIDGATANDKVSSWRVSAVRGGITCEVEIRENRNFGGATLGFAFDPAEQASMGPVQDLASSIRRVC